MNRIQTARPAAPGGRRPIVKARRSVVLGVVGALVAGLLVVLAVRAEGYPVTDVDLTASTVWVTNDAKGVVGRVNRQIDELNSAVKANKPGFDVLQEADMVLVRDAVKHELRPVDVAAVILTGRIGIPETASVSFGGGVIGVTDQTSGALWAGTVDSLTGLDPETTDPLLTTGAGAVVTTSVHGHVFAVAPGRDELWRTQLTDDGGPRDWTTGDDGKPVPPDPGRLPGGALTPVAALVVSQQSPSVQLTAVGDVPVVLDRGTGEVILPDRRVRIPGGAEAVLQQPGPDAEAVLVSTPTAMLKIPLAGGDPVTVAQGVNGTPSAPVWLNGCAHGAWAAQQSSYAVVCGSDPARVIEVPKAGAAATLVFRVNRSVIVLNDQASGNIWLVDADMKLISDWDNVQPQQDSSDQTAQDGDQNSSDQLTNSRADCAPGAVEAAAPEAAADSFGVRAGRATLLPVLANDASADCSMVVISAVTALPAEAGSVTIANGGQALQVTVPAGATGALPAVQYTVDDGQGRQATASATVTVAAADDTRAPVKVRDSVTLVEVGGTVSYTVLPDFSSPTGEDLSLIGASSTTDDSVTFQPNGLITFRDTGSAGAVKKTVDFTVSDGTSQTSGQLIIDVKPEGSTKPVAGPISARGVVGETVTAYPLRGVLSGIREPVKVTAVAPLTAPSGGPTGTPSATAQLSTLDSSVTLTGAAAGTTYFLYTVVAGAGTATGVLRFDVTDPPATPVPPVITPDVGYLVPGRTLVIDPLANDIDPMGSVLAVAGLSRSADSPLTATVHDLQLVQVSSSRTVPTGGVTLTYTVANAAGSSTGQIRVIPVPAPTTPQPPVASDIAVTVRAGDAVTIPITRYATDPTGERLTVKPFAAQSIPDDQGLLFATESAIRYLAPAVPPPTTVRFSYSVVNTDQLSDTRTVTISVTPADPAVNSAPRAPEQVTARVFAGHSATIALPLDGIDPDGDWVTFAGQTEPAPTLGRVDRAGPSAISYTALGSPGLDTVGYLASDPAGKQVKGTARIAVVGPPDVAEPPVAPDLEVVVRPGRTVAIDALGAASDPGGNTPFTFADPALVLPPGLDAELVQDTIVLTAPDADGVFPVKYTVRNSKGLAASGILTVTVSATAPLAPPTAKDVFVEAGSLSADGAAAGVDVASAVTNPSGQVSDLTVALDSAGTAAVAAGAGTGGATVSGTAITVPVTDTRQVLAYRVTNLDGDTATAFVVVPPRNELAPPAQQNQQTEQPAAPPQARANVEPFTITAGQTASVPVLDYVQVDEGRTALVPEGAAMNASQGTVQRLDNSSLQYAVPDTAGGNAVINVQVSDGTSAAVFIPIPVVIIPTVIPPPVFTGASISVEKGSTATQDLAGLVSTANDAQRESLTFSGPSGLGNGLSGSLDGSILTVTADTAAQRGASSTATVTVSDGTNSVTGAVAVTVVGSTAALASVAANRQVEATAGQPVSIPVLDGAYNPFPDTPLTIVAATASGGVPVQISGSTLTVTPPAGLLDQLNLSFTVADATGDADRQVQGTVTVIPLAKPDAPTAVVATSLGKPDSVDVAWRAPALTRPAITAFTVYWSGGSASCAADAGHCPVGPLVPGTSYTFEVSATNDQGEGLRSAPSAEITPDVEPDVPAAPTVTWQAAGSVSVAWKPPNNTGSAIASYLLTANTGAVRTVAAGEGTVSVFTGLDPATEVSFMVSATNSTGKTSQTSAASNSLYPSDTTRAPGKPDLQADVDASKVRTIAVTWAAAEPRGDPADSYLVTVNGTTSTVKAPTTNFTIGGVRDGVEYAVSVAARNHVGDSASSASSSLTTSPDVANVTVAKANGKDRQIQVTVEPSTTAGGEISSYDVYANGSRVGSGGTSQTVTVGSNGTSYSFTARACANSTCSSDGGAAKSASAYGPLATPPTPSSSANGTSVTFGWTWPNGNGRTVSSKQVTVSGVGQVPDTGSWSGDIGYSASRDITIQICVSGPDECTTASVTSPRTVDPPPPTPPTVTRILNRDATGHIGQGPGSVRCLGPRCRFIDVQVTNFPAGVSVVCTVLGRPANPRTTDGAGSVFFDWGWYSGIPEPELATCSGGGVSASG